MYTRLCAYIHIHVCVRLCKSSTRQLQKASGTVSPGSLQAYTCEGLLEVWCNTASHDELRFQMLKDLRSKSRAGACLNLRLPFESSADRYQSILIYIYIYLYIYI